MRHAILVHFPIVIAVMLIPLSFGAMVWRGSGRTALTVLSLIGCLLLIDVLVDVPASHRPTKIKKQLHTDLSPGQRNSEGKGRIDSVPRRITSHHVVVIHWRAVLELKAHLDSGQPASEEILATNG